MRYQVDASSLGSATTCAGRRPRIRSQARSARAIAAAWVCAAGADEKTLVSTTRSRSSPWTRSSGSTTAPWSSPIWQPPIMCAKTCAWACAPLPHLLVVHVGAQAGAGTDPSDPPVQGWDGGNGQRLTNTADKPAQVGLDRQESRVEQGRVLGIGTAQPDRSPGHRAHHADPHCDTNPVRWSCEEQGLQIGSDPGRLRAIEERRIVFEG
jgi:hypothetical protein